VVAQSRYGQLDPVGLWCRRGSPGIIQIPTNTRHYPDTNTGLAQVANIKKTKKHQTCVECELFNELEDASTDVVTARHSQRNA
jgi:hypothetical protein